MWECQHCGLLNYHTQLSCIACFRKKAVSPPNAAECDTQNGQLYQTLRNEWMIGSKCIVFSRKFEQWINANIEKIENKKCEEILTVKNGNYISIVLERFSNN
eukprot:90933_1